MTKDSSNKKNCTILEKKSQKEKETEKLPVYSVEVLSAHFTDLHTNFLQKHHHRHT
jgi:hypothetical protein